MEKQLRILYLPLLIFLICYTIVAASNRFASDDFEFLNKLRQFGWFDSVKWFHQHWNTRWSAIAVLNGILLLSIKLNSLWWYHVISMALLWFGSYRLIQCFSDSEKNVRVLKAGYFSVAFFYACFSIPDVFFWMNTSSMYLLGCIALIFAAAEIFSLKNSAGSYILLFLSSLFIGGAYEPLAFTCMVVSMLIAVIIIKQHSRKIRHFPYGKKIILFVTGIAIGFAISYAGEGHTVRASFLPETTVGFKLWVWIKAIIKMFVFNFPEIIPAFIIACIPWIIFPSKINYSITGRQFFVSSVCFLLLTVISLFPIAFVMSEMGPPRAWTQISLYFVVYFSFAGIHGATFLRKRFDFQKIVIACFLFAVIYIGFTGISASNKAINYSRAYDERMFLINKSSAGVEIKELELQPLPDAGWLHSAELDTSSDHFINRFLKEYMELQFEIKKESDKN